MGRDGTAARICEVLSDSVGGLAPVLTGRVGEAAGLVRARSKFCLILPRLSALPMFIL